MTKTSLLILLLTSTILCQNNISASNDTSNPYSKIKSFYNAQQFAQIFTLQTQPKEKQAKFVSNLAAIYEQVGPIAYDLFAEPGNATDTEQLNLYLVAYKNQLVLSRVGWVVQDGSIMYIVFQTPDKHSSLELFNSLKTKASLSIFFNGVDSLEVQKDQQQGIGFLNAIPIAIEFARQVDAKLIDPSIMIDLRDIVNYYIPQYDTGLLPATVELITKGLLIGNSTTLQNIAIQMSNYPSPALTEYLQTYLGLANIDVMTTTIGLQQSQSVYAASYAIAFTNYKGLNAKQYATSISGLTTKILTASSLIIHKVLLAGKSNAKALQKKANTFLSKVAVTNMMNKLAVKVTALQYATLLNNLTNLVSQTVFNLFTNILSPPQNKAPFETKLFTDDYGVFYQSQGTAVTLGSAQYQVAVNNVTSVTVAILVQGLTVDEQSNAKDQFLLLTAMVLSSPTFCKDFVSRIQQ